MRRVMESHDHAPILLVLRHHGLGDLMTALPTLRALRRTYPSHRLVTTCPSWLEDLARLLRCADDLVCDVPHARTIGPTEHQAADADVLAQAQSFGGAERVVSLRTPGPELPSLLEALSPQWVLSYRYDPIVQSHASPVLDFNDHILERWARLLRLWDVGTREQDLYVPTPDVEPSGQVILHSGAGSPARLWPEERWAAVARHLRHRGWPVLLTGTAREAARVRAIAELAGLGPEATLAGKTTAADLFRATAAAACVVSVDSGLAHVATALRRPAVTLFGPVSPTCWGPPTEQPAHITLWTGKKNETYAERVDPGLLEISAQQVTEALDQLIGEAAEGARYYY